MFINIVAEVGLGTVSSRHQPNVSSIHKASDRIDHAFHIAGFGTSLWNKIMDKYAD